MQQSPIWRSQISGGYYNRASIIIATMAASQLGIQRPRKTEADIELRQAILETISTLQGERTLSALADELGISVKTLSRYRRSGSGKSATLGGDIFFRICELCDDRDISISCRGRILRLAKHRLRRLSAPPRQLGFTFEGSLDIDVPARKGVMRVHKLVATERSGT